MNNSLPENVGSTMFIKGNEWKKKWIDIKIKGKWLKQRLETKVVSLFVSVTDIYKSILNR